MIDEAIETHEDLKALEQRLTIRVGGMLKIFDQVASMPKQGVASTFKLVHPMARSSESWPRLKIQTHLVAPAAWKKHFRLDSDKEKSRALALRTFAASPEHFSRKKDHSRSEAALIALFGASL